MLQTYQQSRIKYVIIIACVLSRVAGYMHMRLCLSELRSRVNACACASVRASRVRYPVHLCGPVPLFGTFNICEKDRQLRDFCD